MKPIHQTKFGTEGNCFDACVASLLEIPLEDVNYFRGEDAWYSDLQHWLAPRGLAYVEVDCSKTNPLYRFPMSVLAIGSGDSPRGAEAGTHAVIVELNQWDRTVVHDPHPSNAGISGEIKAVGFLVATRFVE